MNSTDSIVLAAVSGNISVARRFVRSWVSSLRASADVVDDLALLASELVTNAIHHGDNGEVELTIDHDGSMVYMRVTSRGNVERLAPPSAWKVAGVDAVAGRGLGIVKALADSVEVRRHGDRVSIVVAKTRGT